ncbi:MAG TPA: FecR domain-containing protein [Polyangiaceae bacterium]|nr:FecR domain-containing protein [Polyangiaceae bacterium]
MTQPRFDALASRLLSRANAGETDAPSAEERARAIALVEQAIRRKRRRTLATRATFAAAAVVLLGFGAVRLLRPSSVELAAHAPTPSVPRVVTVVGHPTGGGATVVETGSPAPLVDGRSLASGSRISARPDGHVVLSVSTGTELTVEEGGDVSIVESGANEVFALHAGAVRARVAKLHPGERFVVQTADAEVEVRGTEFRVATVEPDESCGGGTMTRVAVSEGVVSVRHAGQEVRVHPGESWPNCPVKDAQASGHVARRAFGGMARASAAEPTAPLTPAEERVASDLREQNDLFATAFAAKQRGANADAIAGFETFLSRYPGSSLAENAAAQRMKLLRSVDSSRARTAAKAYLGRYPKGFARADAEAILSGSP